MGAQANDSPGGRIERLDQDVLEARLREVARGLFPNRIVDDLEVQHLVRVILDCSLLLTDVYSEERLTHIMHPDRAFLSGLVHKLIDEQPRGEDDLLHRVKRLPDDVRLVGDKALFDLGLLGLRRVKGYELEELGARAYQAAGQALELLAEDRRLREFFQGNRLLMLPLEEEVVFLRQCGEKFRLYADILKQVHGSEPKTAARSMAEVAQRVPLMRAAAEALAEQDEAPGGTQAASPSVEIDPYLDAARGNDAGPSLPSKERLISAYERMLLFSALDMSRLQAALSATVIDQEAAVQALCDEFVLFAAGTRDPRKPPAYFLVGPTGVGKNHLVESLCRLLEGTWGIGVPLLTIEGPHYTYPSDINELRGATRGFIRSDEEGLLTAFHQKSSCAPLGVILVDEVEKAHPQLLTFFLSILDRGTTTDNRGDELNFANCMMFFTSNLGYSEAQQGAAPIGYLDEQARHEVSDRDVRMNLRRGLKPEFVNRVRMVHFNRLTQASAERILDLELARIARRYESLHGLRLELDPTARAELIRRGFSPEYGARHLASILEGACNVEIAKRIRQDDRSEAGQRSSLITWLREMRSGQRAFRAEEVERRVLDLARARLAYGTLRVVYRDGRFEYLAEGERSR